MALEDNRQRTRGREQSRDLSIVVREGLTAAAQRRVFLHKLHEIFAYCVMSFTPVTQWTGRDPRVTSATSTTSSSSSSSSTEKQRRQILRERCNIRLRVRMLLWRILLLLLLLLSQVSRSIVLLRLFRRLPASEHTHHSRRGDSSVLYLCRSSPPPLSLAGF